MGVKKKSLITVIDDIGRPFDQTGHCETHQIIGNFNFGKLKSMGKDSGPQCIIKFQEHIHMSCIWEQCYQSVNRRTELI